MRPSHKLFDHIAKVICCWQYTGFLWREETITRNQRWYFAIKERILLFSLSVSLMHKPWLVQLYQRSPNYLYTTPPSGVKNISCSSPKLLDGVSKQIFIFFKFFFELGSPTFSLSFSLQKASSLASFPKTINKNLQNTSIFQKRVSHQLPTTQTTSLNAQKEVFFFLFV